MNLTNLKEKLGNNICHIHKQQPEMTTLENGNLKINTCCILFKRQLHLLLVDKQEEKLVDNFPMC